MTTPDLTVPGLPPVSIAFQPPSQKDKYGTLARGELVFGPAYALLDGVRLRGIFVKERSEKPGEVFVSLPAQYGAGGRRHDFLVADPEVLHRLCQAILDTYHEWLAPRAQAAS